MISAREMATQHISFEFGLEAVIDNYKHSWGFRYNDHLNNHQQLSEQIQILAAIIDERDRQWMNHINIGGKIR